jgi:hypothetical protein
MNNHYYAHDVNIDCCEATGCTARATTQLSVRVGDLGAISLSLCSSCVKRFVDEDVNIPNIKDTKTGCAFE